MTGDRIEPCDKDRELARVIVEFMRTRNGGELLDALDDQTVRSRDLMLDELAAILAHGGHPPNWVTS